MGHRMASSGSWIGFRSLLCWPYWKTLNDRHQYIFNSKIIIAIEHMCVFIHEKELFVADDTFIFPAG